MQPAGEFIREPNENLNVELFPRSRPFRQVLRQQSQNEHKDENIDQDRDSIVTEFSYINEII